MYIENTLKNKTSLHKCAFWVVWFVLVFGFLAIPHGLRDLSSPTRDRTHAPLQWKHRVLTTGHQGSPISVLFFFWTSTLDNVGSQLFTPLLQNSQ